MKKIVALSLVVFLITTGFSCRSKKEAVKTAEAPAKNEYENSVLVMQRTPCFGKCPTFTITIKGNGQATYEGKNNVSKMGAFEKTLSKDETSQLFKAFIDGGIYAFNDEYTARVSDLPSCYITFTHDGKTKKIHDYFEAPAKLKELEKLVDTIANSDNWIQKQK